MKTYASLSWKYLKGDMKRTWILLFEIFITCALITAVGIIVESISKTELEYVKNHNGSYHAILEFDDIKSARNSIENIYVDSGGIMYESGFFKPEDTQETVILRHMDKTFLDLSNIRIKDGILPSDKDEIALEERMVRYLGINKTGDSVNLKVQDFDGKSFMNIEYRVVGILQDDYMSMMTGYGIGLTGNESGRIFAGLRIKENYDPEDKISLIARTLGAKGKIDFNNSLLLAEKNNDRSEPAYFFLAAVLLIAASGAIYSVFHISVTERTRQSAILRTCGMTSRQLGVVVFDQAMILMGIAVVPGLLTGVAGAWSVIKLSSIINEAVSVFAVSVKVILWSFLVTSAAVLSSAIGPACIAGKTTPAGALNYFGKKVKVDIKKPYRSIFPGIIPMLAHRNIKRHKKAYRLTVLSISAGVSLFILFGYFISGADPEKILKTSFPGHFVLERKSVNIGHGFSGEDIDKILELEGVRQVFGSMENSVNLLLAKNDISDDFSSYLRDKFKYEAVLDEKTGLYLNNGVLYGYTGNILENADKYLVEGSINIDDLKNNQEVLIVNYYSTGTDKLKVSSLDPGDEIILRKMTFENNEVKYEEDIKVRIGGILSGYPHPSGMRAIGMGIVVHEDLFAKLTGTNVYKRFDVLLDEGSNREYIGDVLREIAQGVNQSVVLSLDDEIKKLEAQKQQLSFLFTGLGAAVVLIGLFSIINTIGTNLIIRTREFSVLRALGMTRMGIKGVILVEGLMYGLAGSLFGIAAGNLLALVFYHFAKNSLTYLSLKIPFIYIAGALSGGILLGVAAAFMPGRRISGLNIIEGIKY